MNKIALIYMGGTFGCIGEPLAPMPYDAFQPQLERILPPQYAVDCFKAPSIKDSSACTAADWLLLVQQIQGLQLEGYTHFVVIHGTDTMSYASATLARFLGQTCHVVITGSQYPLLNTAGDDTREFTDAIENLYLALESVQRLASGTYQAFHHQIFHGQTVLKTHTTELDAFSGVSADAPCDTITNAMAVDAAMIARADELAIVNLMHQPVRPAHLAQQLENIAQRPPHFLILQGFGTGNIAVNDAILAQFQQLRAQGCLVVLTTQVTFGKIDQRYAISDWVHCAGIATNTTHGHADLYAKLLQLYLQYDDAEDWYRHWDTTIKAED